MEKLIDFTTEFLLKINWVKGGSRPSPTVVYEIWQIFRLNRKILCRNTAGGAVPRPYGEIVRCSRRGGVSPPANVPIWELHRPTQKERHTGRSLRWNWSAYRCGNGSPPAENPEKPMGFEKNRRLFLKPKENKKENKKDNNKDNKKEKERDKEKEIFFEPTHFFLLRDFSARRCS